MSEIQDNQSTGGGGAITGPKVLVPSESVKLGAGVEQEMVQFVIQEIERHRKDMGWQGNNGAFVDNSWVAKRALATRMFEFDFSHREKPGTLFGRINLTLNMAAQFIEQHKSRITDDLFGSEKFFGVGPEGAEDATPVLQDVEHVLHDTSARLGMQEKFKQAVQSVLVRGEAVPKITRQVSREQITEKVRVMVVPGTSEPQRDSAGGFIVEADEWVDHPENPMMRMLKRDTRVSLPKNVPVEYSQGIFEIPVTVKTIAGCDFAFPHWADLTIPVTYPTIDKAPLLAHTFMMSVPDLLDMLPPGMEQSPVVQDYLKTIQGQEPQQETEERRARNWRGEQEVNKGTPMNDRGYRERRYTEVYWRYDWRKNGRFEHLAMLFDHDAQWPVFYSQAAEYMPWNTKAHPFREPIRIHPYEDRWFGRGYYERFGDSALFVDKCWCRIEAELQKSGNIIVENRDATEQGAAGKPLRFRTTETLQVRGTARPEDALAVVKVTPQIMEIKESLDTMLQKMQSEAGVTSPGDATTAGMDAANTLGGMQILESQKNTMLREREGEIVPGVNASLTGVAEVEFHDPDKQALLALLTSKQPKVQALPQLIEGAPPAPPAGAAAGPMPPVDPMAGPPAGALPALPMPLPAPEMRVDALLAWAKENKGQLNRVIKLYVTRSRQAQLFDNSSRIIQVIDKWLMYPPQVRPNLWRTFANMLRALDVQNPEELLGPKDAPVPPAGPMAGPCPLPGGGAGMPSPIGQPGGDKPDAMGGVPAPGLAG